MPLNGKRAVVRKRMLASVDRLAIAAAHVKDEGALRQAANLRGVLENVESDVEFDQVLPTLMRKTLAAAVSVSQARRMVRREA